MGRRVRAALVTLSSAPWRRAPWLLLRRPGVLATVAGATAVLAASLGAVPLFVSSVGTASVEVQAAERCPRDTGVTYGQAVGALSDEDSNPFALLGNRLGPAVLWAHMEASLVQADGSRATPVVILTRDGALDHVDVIDGSPGPGLWVSDRVTDNAGLRPGDRAVLLGGDAPTPVDLPIAGVYRDETGTVLDDFWCSHGDLLLLQGIEPVPPPPVLLTDRATFDELVAVLDARQVQRAWEAPLGDDLSLADANRLVDDLACDTYQLPRPNWCAAVLNSGGAIAFGTGANQTRYRDAEDFVSRFFRSALPFVTDRAQGIQTSVRGGVWPVAGFAALAGVGLVGAAAALWFDRRRREVTILTVRGVSPAGLGVKAVLELALALAVGSAAGVGLAYGIVLWLGPSPVLEPAALGRAALAGVLAALAAALTVALVVAGRVRTHHARRRRWAWLRVVPWELVLGATALLSYRRLGEWGVPVSQGADVTRVDVLGLLFPVLFLVTAVAVAMRLLAAALGPLRTASRTWPTALYLAVRRVARYRVAVIGLVAAAAIAAGVLGYAGTLNRSLDATLEAKAKTFIGSDIAVRLSPDQPIPPELSARATEVAVYQRAWVDAGRREDVIVHGIDPSTFERAAFWDSSFSDTSLGELLGRLAAPPRDGRVPAVVVGADMPTTAEVGIIAVGTRRFTIDRVADAQAFPGMKRGNPTLYVAASALADLDLPRPISEVWIRGDRGDSLAALAAAGTEFREGRRVDEVVDQASFLTVSWTFGFMQSLGIAAGVLVLGGIAVYLDARRRGRLLGYAFARRMGLSPAVHRRALLLELTASVVVGCWLGLGIGLGGARLAYGRIDPVPGFQPEPLLRPAVAVVVGLATTALVVAGLAAVLAQRRTDRDDPVEVLRAGV